MKFLYPVPKNSLVTFTYDQHVAKAKKNGWCYQPGNCTTFYFGGIDWGISTGTPVAAAADGQVTVARSDGSGYGTHVRLQHAEGYLTVYGHLSRLNCRVNDVVKAGDVIGLSGSTGNSTGPHLHFEARKNNLPFDPWPYLVYAPAPVPEPVDLPAFPKLPAAVVTADVLNIRLAPGTLYRVVGSLRRNAAVDVIRAHKSGDDLWLEIGYQQFAAMKYGGQQLMKWE